MSMQNDTDLTFFDEIEVFVELVGEILSNLS